MLSSLQQSTHLFEINPGARWYYEWESAATKAQRFTKHVLRVYVLERLSLGHGSPQFASPNASAGSTNQTLRVVAIASSSEFMVVSYRRATSEIRADRRILAMLVDSASSSQAAAALLASSVDGDSDGGLLPLDAVPALLQHAQFTATAAAAAGEKHALFPSLHHQRNSPTTTSSQGGSPLRYPATTAVTVAMAGTQIQDHGDLMWQEKRLWESSHPETLMLTKHLAIIYYFLASADATRFTHCLSQWSALFADNWGSPQSPGHAQAFPAVPASAQRYHPYGSPDRSDRTPVATSTNAKVSWYFLMKLASSMSQAAPYRRSGSTGEELHSERVALLVETCADVAGWLVFDVDNIRLFRRVFAEYAPTLLNKDALRGTFVKWVRLVYDLIGHFLASSSASNGRLTSTQALVEDIIAIVFKSDALEALRPKVLSILSSTSMQGLAGFVAQVRSHFVKKSQQQGGGGPSSPEGTATRNNMALTRVLQSFSSPLHGRWHFDGAQTVVEPLDRSGGAQAHDISLGGMLHWLRECSVVTIDVQDEDRIGVRSLWGADSAVAGGDEQTSSGMSLIADGHARVFSHFPSGLSSMLTLGDRRYGDYQASFVAPDALALELYAWSETGASEGFYARESATPAWGSESGGNAVKTSSAVRWKLRLALERFGRPTAAPGASILRVEALVEKGVLSASRANARGMETLQGRLGAIDDWKALYQVSATYRRVQ